ncbi:glutathione S-transferase [Kineobactrum sediminis]|uniref:Glutathione S-transferase n=1 Tax=Kineobactrum sediminis TaxID=1905677 RepID=A0A2N5XZA0_9GAMM|nr:glutathione S-transferase N-terminal domain-containing protein [Kineobactrum sediminis]PLW81466.1 glutathione S-transferase [Kineobactrum sediminis]
MIELFTWSTPNGHKASIMLEELGIPYKVTAIDIGKGQQEEPAFRRVSPNGKIPAIVDYDVVDAAGESLRLFESGNILIYLAEKTGHFLPHSGSARTETLGWLFFQVGHLGPMVGQWHWFKTAASETIELALERYRNKAQRLLGVMDQRLGETPYLGGGEYSIADIASYAWALSARDELVEAGVKETDDLTHLNGWLDRVGGRPAVKRGMEIPNDQQKADSGIKTGR